MERNSGIFWAMLQCSLLIGNTFVYFQFQDLDDIDKDTRLTVSLLFDFNWHILSLWIKFNYGMHKTPQYYWGNWGDLGLICRLNCPKGASRNHVAS